MCDSLILTNHQKNVSLEMIFANVLKCNNFANFDARETKSVIDIIFKLHILAAR